MLIERHRKIISITHDIVTRAEFGTVFSRLLFGKKYNVKDESLVNKEEWYWYRDHLA